MQAACVRYITVHAFFEGEFCLAAAVIALPVARTRAALAPIFLHIAAVDEHLARRALVTPCKIPSEHTEIRAHGKCECNVIIQNDAPVRTDGNIISRFLQIGVPRCGDVANGGRLPAANALCLAGDADGSSTDAHLDEVRARIRQKAESI
ncbi:hypothetical protein SDC9_154269 [bioreactor metagenome]|uniref:Uncharacterized protein n=1 Tax=bioreactor metagenome TaxID=1076179 RepID=A0A645EZT7_9ZZZZ